MMSHNNPLVFLLEQAKTPILSVRAHVQRAYCQPFNTLHSLTIVEFHPINILIFRVSFKANMAKDSRVTEEFCTA
jgi:hypothetical protein